ncbi:MAG: FtsX-like permease family protein, partial [Moraxellaceae bacterium]
GAQRSSLIKQFLTEALLLSFFAVILSLALIELLLPFFAEVSGKKMTLDWLHNPALILGLVIIGLLTGLLSGIYPAFVLSSFDPVRVLKGNSKTGTGNTQLRKGLVVLQFAVSLALIIGTFVINSQLKFMQSADLGFDKNQVIIVPLRPPMVPRVEAFRQELLSNSKFKSVAAMNEIVGIHHNTHEFNYEGMQPEKWIYNPALIVSEDFGKTFGLEIIAGRDFSRDHPSDDREAIIINEAMVKKLGWGAPENALGKRFDTPMGNEKVIGVVKDFNFLSLENPIGPFVLDLPNKGQGEGFWRKYIAVRVEPGDYPATIAHLENTWSKLVPEFPLEY